MKLHLPISLRCCLLATFLLAAASIYANFSTTLFSGSIPEGYIEVIVKDAKSLTESAAYASGANVAYRLVYQDGGITVESPAQALMPSAAGSRYFTAEQAETPASLHISKAETTLFTLDSNESLSWQALGTLSYTENTSSASGGLVYASSSADLSWIGNEKVEFVGNYASYGGAIYGGNGSTITLSDNGTVSFSGNTASDFGGAIYGNSDSTITLSNNDTVTFSGNTAFSGGAICGGGQWSTITLSNNGEVSFSGNTAEDSGGAIYGGISSTITLSNNGTVTFSENTAESSGGAIYGDSYSTITLSDNGEVTFSGNTAFYGAGGAIDGYEDSTITLSNNGTVTFSGNTARYYGGAIYSSGNLHIRNNDSVEFAGNVEKSDSVYRLRSIYVVGGSGDTVSLSAAAGKSIIFRDSMYIGSGTTVDLNADYTDAEGNILAQKGDILFTGATTEADLLAAKGSAGTAEEILNSRTTEVLAMTNLYGGRLRVEDGAVYRGYGMTAHAGADATILVKDATLDHAGHNIVMGSGSCLTLEGDNLLAGNVMLQEGSTLVLDSSSAFGVNDISGSLQWSEGAQFLWHPGEDSLGANTVLLYVSEGISGWDSVQVSTGSSSYSSGDFTWVDGLLVLNYEAERFNRYFNGSASFSSTQRGTKLYHHYQELAFLDVTDGAIDGGYNSHISLSDNDTVTFIGNTAFSGGAIYGGSSGTITLSNNDTVTFSGNTASNGGAICGYDGSSITLSDNDTVTFSGNTASDGGAIYGRDASTITLSNNGEVSFSGNTAEGSGGAIDGAWDSTITLSNNGEVSFSGNRTYYRGGAIYGGEYSTITLSDNDTVTFSGNTAYDDGGAIYGGSYSTVTLSSNGTVNFSGNTAYDDGGAIYGGSYSTITLSDNETVTFSGNTSFRGGAIYGRDASTITLSDNGEVSFSGNTASYGGAIYGYDGSSIMLSNNGTVTFSGNTASGSSYGYGGAIYSYGNLHIRNNDSVEFTGNVEKSDSTYRLRSIYVYGGSGDVVSLSAAEGKSIIFRDSMYIGSGTTVDFNADYNGLAQKGDILFTGATMEADLLAAKGSAGTAAEVLNSRTTEVLAMTNLYGGRLRVEDGAVYKGYGMTVQEGSEATVRVKDATLNHKGYTLSFASGTMLELEGANSLSGDLLMKSGSSLSFVLQEATAVAGRHSGALTVQEGVELRLQLDCEDWQGSEKTLLLIASDAGSAASCAESSLRTVGVSNALWGYKDAYWQEGNLFVDVRKTDTVTWDNAAGDYRWDHLSANWTDEGYRYSYVQGAHVVLGQSGAGTIRVLGDMAIAGMSVEGGSSYCLEWAEDSSLAVADYLRVDSRSSLDFGGDLSLVSVENQGHLTVAGDLTALSAISGMGQLNVAGTLTAASLQAAGLTADILTLTEVGAQNRIGSDVSFAGDATVAGALAVEGSLSAQKVSIGGELSAATVQTSDLVAGSVQVQALTADTLTLTESGAQSRIGSDVALSGAATVAGGLQIEGALSAASLQTEALAAESLTLTESGVQNRIGSDVALSGAATVAGGLQIEGALSAASLQTESLAAESLTLTETGAQNRIGSDVSFAGDATVAGALAVEGSLSAQKVSIGGALSAATVQTSDLLAGSVQVQALTADTLTLTEAGVQNRIGSDVSFAGDATVAGALAVEGSLSAQKVRIGGALSAATVQTSDLLAGSVQVQALTADTLMLTESGAQSRIGSDVSFAGDATVAGALAVEGSLSAQKVSIDGELSASTVQTSDLFAGSVQVQALTADTLTLTESGAQSRIGSDVALSGAATVAGGLQIEGALSAASLQTESLAAESLTLTASGAQSRIGSDVSFAGDATVAGALAVEGSLSAQKVSIGGELSAAMVQTSDLLAGSVQVQAVTADTLTLTESGVQNRIGNSVTLSGAAMVAGSLQIEGAFSAASLQAEALTAESLTLTEAGTQSRIGSDVALSGAAAVAGGLKIEGAFSAASLQAGSLSAESLTLTDAAARNKVEGLLELRGSEVMHRVSGDLAAEMVSLAAGATLETDGVLTSSTVQMSGKVGGLTAAAFGAAEMDFVLDRKALEGLNLSHMQTATIARTEESFAEDFSVLLNGSATESTDAAAYTYTIAGAGNEVQVTADYRWWDTRVWYRGGWVGEAEWTDHLIAGYDAVDGVETIDLGGESFAGYTLMVELEEGVSAVQVSNGALSFEYIDMFAGQLNIGPGTEVQVAELWGEGLTLSLSGEVTKLTVSEYLTVGTLAMDYATLTVKDAEVAELTGDAGSLVISEGGVVTVDSDVTLSGMRNGGSLDIGSHKLVVNGLTSEGGDVTAGEVETRSNMRTAAQFNKLVADKVTVRNSNSSTRYTDDLSVGAGSAIGELVAETLTVREGTVMLGHDERATAQELQKLTLNAATAELVLNEATSLAVTNSLSAKSGAKVQLKKDATLVYKELGIGNRQGAGMVTVDAYGLSRGATLSLEKAHVTLRSSETTELDHLLAESSVENLGSGTLKLTHADNRLTGIAATGGDVEVYNSAVSHDLQELYIASQMTVSVLLSAPEEAFDAAQEATLNVLGTASFGSEATLKANLTLQAGATLEMQGPVHMGSTVTLTAGSLLGDALLNRVQTMLPGDSTTLFTGVDKLVLFDGTTGYTYLPGDLTAADDVPASRYFTNLMGDDYVLTFRGDGSEGDLAIEMVPEPATATLSLLALAALASRRRRK